MSEDANVQTDSIFSSLEIDTIGEIMNISMGSAATAASTLLDNKTNITTPIVKMVPIDEFNIGQLEPAIAVEIQYVEGISGSNILILQREDVRKILSLMMMTDLPEDFKIDEMAESAICELMNQMMGSSATVLSCFLGRTINISTPQTMPIEALDDFKERYFGGESALVTIEFTLTIGDSVESVFMCAMKISLAREIINVSLNFDTGDDASGSSDAVADAAPEIPPAPEAPPAAPPPMQPQMEPPVQAPVAEPPAGPAPAAYPQYPQQYPTPAPGAYPQYPQQPAYPPPPPYGYDQQPIAVRNYNYNDFGQNGVNGQEAPLNLDLVMNVPVVMTVELGRTKRKIKEILEFGQGTIVELDKQAGSQVDVIVNGQLIAHGDVVVVDDNFSIRITEIVKNRDPMSML